MQSNIISMLSYYTFWCSCCRNLTKNGLFGKYFNHSSHQKILQIIWKRKKRKTCMSKKNFMSVIYLPLQMGMKLFIQYNSNWTCLSTRHGDIVIDLQLLSLCSLCFSLKINFFSKSKMLSRSFYSMFVKTICKLSMFIVVHLQLL